MQNLTAADVAALYARAGYRRTSHKHRILSRIDRPDWVAYMARKMRRTPADFYIDGEDEPSGNWADNYRRVYSEDKITVPHDICQMVPGSGHDPIGYGPRPGDTT